MVVRITSGVLGAALVLTFLALPQPAPLILFGAIWLLGVYELGRLEGAPLLRIALVLLLHLAILYVVNLVLHYMGELVLDYLRFFMLGLYALAAIIQLLLGDVVLHRYLAGRSRVLNFPGHSFFFIAVPLWMLWVEASLVPLSVVVVLGMAWSADTGAIAAGKLFGRWHLTPRISPGKTLEGLVGGWLAMTAFILLAKLFISQLQDYPFHGLYLWSLHPALVAMVAVALIAACLTVVGFLGDITFSAIKRSAAVKDFGGALPGHGGILDRIDALLFITPWYFLSLVLFSDLLFL
ncbi:MAG: hypothetical protein A2Y63_00550 [Candidatus Riflebacteria bacterium RBG_13_59_9]|nr:MAG: hypothetical protein A2Y63_00550 [Candidatus Riflebacteria bacterium RBG_13_59_9]